VKNKVKEYKFQCRKCGKIIYEKCEFCTKEFEKNERIVCQDGVHFCYSNCAICLDRLPSEDVTFIDEIAEPIIHNPDGSWSIKKTIAVGEVKKE